MSIMFLFRTSYILVLCFIYIFFCYSVIVITAVHIQCILQIPVNQLCMQTVRASPSLVMPVLLCFCLLYLLQSLCLNESTQMR